MKFGIERGALFGTNSPKPSKPQPLEIMRECNDSISSPPVDVPLMIDAEIPVVPSLPPAPPAPILNVNHSSSSKKNTTTKSRILTTNTVNTLKNNTRDDNVKFNLVNRPSASQLLQAKTKLISVPRREGETVREQSVAGTGMKTYQSTVQSNGDLAGESVMNELARHMRARRQMVMPTSASLSVESTRDALNSVDQQWCEHSPLRV